jgi:purine-binding chemotaxis protein CheW
MTASVAHEYMVGIIKVNDQPIEQILDVKTLTQGQAVTKQNGESMQLSGVSQLSSDNIETDFENDNLQQLVCCTLDSQTFAFHLQDVEEIVRVPSNISQLPQSVPSVLGLVNLRGRIIPIVDLAGCIGMMRTEINEASRIVITQNSDFGSVGFVVAKVNNVVSIAESEREEVPSMCNDGAEAGVLEAVYRSNGGKRLVSIINLSNIYSRALSSALTDITNDVHRESDMNESESVSIKEDDCEQYVIFWINGQEYGVSIDDTQEITRVPEKLESVPSTPDYLKGIVNLRGTVLPVIDLRSRLGIPSSASSERQRIVVLTKDKQRTGFIVDGVAEVKTVVKQTIEVAPSLSDVQSEFLGRLIKLNDEKRIIQIIEPNVLLNDNAVLKAQEHM